ncbi:MAG: hypothetical protein ACRECR_06085 [Thermoplasmata archaeon]
MNRGEGRELVEANSMVFEPGLEALEGLSDVAVQPPLVLLAFGIRDEEVTELVRVLAGEGQEFARGPMQAFDEEADMAEIGVGAQARA